MSESAATAVADSSKSRKGHAGGPGKKGKKFVEDKTSLLSILDTLKALNKPEKIKKEDNLLNGVKNKGAPIAKSGANATKLLSKEAKKSVEKKRAQKLALLEAKKGILAKAKERKQARKDPKPGNESAIKKSDTPAEDKKKKKRVSFTLH